MTQKRNFYYYIDDLELLKKVHGIVDAFWGDAPNVIFESKDQIDLSIQDGVIIVNNSLEYFQENLMGTEKQNLLVVINDIVNDFEDYPIEVFISKNRVLTSLSAILYDLKNTDKFDGKYFSVDIENITLNVEAPCDLYLKISDEKFLKCVYKGDVYDEEIKERYSKKGQYLWVEKTHFYLFGDFLYGQDDLEKEVSAPFDIEKTNDLKLIYDMANSCGISEKTMNTVESSMDSIKENSKGKIKNLLKDFDALKGTFLFSHSHFLSLLCVEIASKQSWFKPQHIDKLVLASLVHDMGYKDPKNALNESLPLSKVKQLEPMAMEDTLNHIDAVLEILESNNSVDSDVINIIKRHHGARGEESYPTKSFATEMDLLSGIFLLSHSFTVALFKMCFNTKKVDKILAYIDLVYNKGNLKKIMPDFKKHILEIFND